MFHPVLQLVGLTLLFISLVYCVAYMFLNFFSFYQVVRPFGHKSVNKYLYLFLYIILSSLFISAVKLIVVQFAGKLTVTCR